MRSAIAAVIAAVALCGGVLVLDRLLQDRSLFQERPPDRSMIYLVRSLMLLATAALGLLGLRAVLSHHLADGPSERQEVSTPATVIGLVMAVSLSIVLLIAPSSVGNVAAEDGPIEWLSAVFAFGAAGIIGAEALRRHRASGRRERPAVVVLVILALLIAVIGLEEVSWFQRVVGIDAPGAFQDRNQPELNLHNEATGLFENLYYTGAFAFTVLLPYLFAGRRLPDGLRWIEHVLPTRLVFYGAAVAAAMSYEMWEIIPIQLTFHVTLVALLSDPSPPGHRRLAVVIVAIMVAMQASYLVWGDGMIRRWDDTELRELIIPYGFLLYGLGLRAGRTSTVAAGPDRYERRAELDA